MRESLFLGGWGYFRWADSWAARCCVCAAAPKGAHKMWEEQHFWPLIRLFNVGDGQDFKIKVSFFWLLPSTYLMLYMCFYWIKFFTGQFLLMHSESAPSVWRTNTPQHIIVCLFFSNTRFKALKTNVAFSAHRRAFQRHMWEDKLQDTHVDLTGASIHTWSPGKTTGRLST